MTEVRCGGHGFILFPAVHTGNAFHWPLETLSHIVNGVHSAKSMNRLGHGPLGHPKIFINLVRFTALMNHIHTHLRTGQAGSEGVRVCPSAILLNWPTLTRSCVLSFFLRNARSVTGASHLKLCSFHLLTGTLVQRPPLRARTPPPPLSVSSARWVF